MSLEAIDRAATPEMVVIGTGMMVNSSRKYHKPSFDGAMKADCGSFSQRNRGQRLERRHAEMQGFDACTNCFGGGRR